MWKGKKLNHLTSCFHERHYEKKMINPETYDLIPFGQAQST